MNANSQYNPIHAAMEDEILTDTDKALVKNRLTQALLLLAVVMAAWLWVNIIPCTVAEHKELAGKVDIIVSTVEPEQGRLSDNLNVLEAAHREASYMIGRLEQHVITGECLYGIW